MSTLKVSQQSGPPATGAEHSGRSQAAQHTGRSEEAPDHQPAHDNTPVRSRELEQFGVQTRSKLERGGDKQVGHVKLNHSQGQQGQQSESSNSVRLVTRVDSDSVGSEIQANLPGRGSRSSANVQAGFRGESSGDGNSQSELRGNYRSDSHGQSRGTFQDLRGTY